MQRPDLTTLACVNPECQYFGRPHQDNLTIRVFFPAPRLCSAPHSRGFMQNYPGWARPGGFEERPCNCGASRCVGFMVDEQYFATVQRRQGRHKEFTPKHHCPDGHRGSSMAVGEDYINFTQPIPPYATISHLRHSPRTAPSVISTPPQ